MNPSINPACAVSAAPARPSPSDSDRAVRARAGRYPRPQTSASWRAPSRRAYLPAQLEVHVKRRHDVHSLNGALRQARKGRIQFGAFGPS